MGLIRATADKLLSRAVVSALFTAQYVHQRGAPCLPASAPRPGRDPIAVHDDHAQHAELDRNLRDQRELVFGQAPGPLSLSLPNFTLNRLRRQRRLAFPFQFHVLLPKSMISLRFPLRVRLLSSG